ncbi:MAG: hypothetical protein AAF235_09675, partial [Planctomycetota bacterium]
MPLSHVEERLSAEIASRGDALLEDLKRHVAIPTGMNNRDALDETRGLFRERLERLGATTTMVEGDPKPSWLHGVKPGGHVPATAVCERKREGRPSVLVAGHLDTVHDPRGDFQELSVRPGGKTATGPGCVDMKGGLV